MSVQLRDPAVLVAFEGWNDAAEAASGVAAHIIERYPSELFTEIDGDDYFDYQIVRPKVVGQGADRRLEWPMTRVHIVNLPTRDLVVITGAEPNMHWRRFAAQLVSLMRSLEPRMIVLCGAMLTDSPHTRPVPVQASSADEALTAALGLTPNTYEGPTGILGVLSDAATRLGMGCVSLWASVPHYVASQPNPKAMLALLRRVEDLLDVAIDPGDLAERARTWQEAVDRMAADDPDVSEYVAGLEEAADHDELPQASGDVLAAELERYLRRRDREN